MRSTLATFAAALSLLASCGGGSIQRPTPDTRARLEPAPLPLEPVPSGRLPRDVRPTHYALALRIVPTEERFSGTIDIDVSLERPRSTIHLHSREHHVTRATVTPAGGEPVDASFAPVDPGGVVALGLARPVGPGRVTIHIEFDAPFDRQLKGLYRVDTGGRSYAFTQFEAISARFAFPCFDEPSFKTPWDVTLTVPAGQTAIANTREIGRAAAAAGLVTVRYATTEPLPTYLIAFAVGDLDVVEAPALAATRVRPRALPLRGVAAHGRGRELAFALAEAPAIVTALEDYFGVSYPYDKLDLIAVPDFDAGAMENAGAITFREWLLLVDPSSATEDQRRAVVSVMAHELSHMWFGDLVTMPWWDDIWLNEAFATWMAARIVATVHPEHQSAMSLLSSVHGAMGADSLVNARRIRQPILSNHDIRNAFDSITYQKGAGVLSMFESYLGPNVFQQGIRRYVDAHRFGSATADDLLSTLSQVSERDVATPFRTFLDQPGVPLIAVRVVCDAEGNRLELAQSRALPVGSTGDRNVRWHVPVCARYFVAQQVHTTCTELDAQQGTLALEGGACPDWVMPNAGGSGYYRWSLAPADLARLRRAGWAALDARERLSVTDSIDAAFDMATTPTRDVLAALETLARDESRVIATTPMGIASYLGDFVVTDTTRPRFEAWARRLYAPVLARVGMRPREGENVEVALLRARVLSFLAATAKDRAVRAELARLGRAYVGHGGDGALHPEAVPPELADIALSMAVQDGDAPFFDALLERLWATDDAVVRGRIIYSLASTLDPALAERARALSLDSRLRVSEVMAPLWGQMGDRRTRDATWRWFQAHVDPLMARIASNRGGSTPWLLASFCDEAHATEGRAFFAPRLERLPGAPRNLESALEAVQLCIARAAAHAGAF